MSSSVLEDIMGMKQVDTSEEDPKTKLMSLEELGVKVHETDKGYRLSISNQALKLNLYHMGCRYSFPYNCIHEPVPVNVLLDDLYEEAKGCELFDMDLDQNPVYSFLEWLGQQGVKIEEKLQLQLSNGQVSFAGIKILFKEGETVTFRTKEGDLQAMDISTVNDEYSFFTGPYKKIVGKVLTHNGINFVMGTEEVKIPFYSDIKDVKDLPIHHITPEERVELLERGNRYYEYLKKASYLQCSGTLFRQEGYFYSQTFNATGRVMIDILGMKQADTDYNAYRGCPRYDAEEMESLDGSVHEDVLVLSLPVVYGFSFRCKKWGEIRIDTLRGVDFRDDAFDHLVLDKDIKNLLYALVDSSDLASGKDFVDNKGGGLIFLLHGTPGVGKTFTAEAISERLARPLYMISVGEIGTTAMEVERRLKDVLETAQRWNAVLLLDECDIFLERRKEDDMERNAVVSVFLRMIEYYQGILFMTTNRVKDLDPAFYSRISLPIHYNPLLIEGRESIWYNHMIGHGVSSELASELAPPLSTYNLNGRQIKNCVRIGVAISGREKRPMVVDDILRVIRYLNDFQSPVE